MPQHEYVPRSYEVVQQDGHLIESKLVQTELTLKSTDPGVDFQFSFQALRPGLFRTTFSSKSHPLPPHPSAPRPKADLAGVEVTSESSDFQKIITIGDVKALIDWTDAPVVSLRLAGQKTPIHCDLPFRSYAVDSKGISHYTHYKRDTLHVGLGEKAAPMNLSNRHFVLAATDSFGYDVYRTDPLYKHIPLLINATPEGCVGIFSTSHSCGTYDVGSEIDGLWGHFKVYRQDYGGLEEYLMMGNTIQDVVRLYADLVGYPKLVPRWAFGYIAGGMKYSMLDEPPAADTLMEFAEKLKKHDIPCSAFQLSSGYTVAEIEPKTRNVFTWNRHRFPDPENFVSTFRSSGIRILANIKPYVLQSHPEFERLVASNAFFTDPRTKKAGVARLWSAGGGESGEGGHIDFTSESGSKWWYEGVRELRRIGVEGIWNDNNEYTIHDDDWQCALQTNVVKQDHNVGTEVGLWGRATQCELMAKISHDAVVDLRPNERPFVLTRSATAGTMRYAASTWSGDNVTSWDGMKGANSLSLNAGISLLQCYGHDIGGFEGPQPSPELLLRWIQLGVYSSRFAINCFKTDENDNTIGGVIEPWMYEEITSLIRDAIKRRYELIPYLYSLMLESHSTALPPQRWIGHGYESDPEIWSSQVMSGETQYWLGDTLLIGGVYQPGETSAKLYLPRRSDEDMGFINLHEPYQHLSAGQWVDIKSEWKESIPVLAKVGGALIVGKDAQTRSPGDHTCPSPNIVEDDFRAIEIFPPRGESKAFKISWYEDDGVASRPSISSFTFRYTSRASDVEVEFQVGDGNQYVPMWKELRIILPMGDERPVISSKGALRRVEDSRGRAVFIA